MRALRRDPFRLPTNAIVTSRYDLASPPQVHYALVCFSQIPVIRVENPEDKVRLGELRNLLSGRPIGASQVTAVVERYASLFDHAATEYQISIRAELVYPYFVRLQRPMKLSKPSDGLGSESDWEAVVHRLKDHQIWASSIQETTFRQRTFWEKWNKPS